MTPPPARRTHFLWTREFTVWFAVALLTGTVGWIKSINLLSIVAYLSLTLILLNGFLAWRMVWKVSATRTPPPPLFAGETATIVGRVRNGSGQRAIVSVQEAAGAAPRAWFLPALAGRVTVEFTGPVEFTTRGRHPLPPLEAVSGYPFGLVHIARPLAGSDGDVVVMPALGGIDLPAFRRWLTKAAAVGDATQRVARWTAPTDGDVRGVRPYRRGDSARDVHWKTSARRDQLMVREYDRTPPRDLILVLDPWVPSATPDVVSAAKLEWALSLTVSVAWAWVHGDQPGAITLLVGGERWTSRVGSGTPAFVRTGFAALADVRGSTTVVPLPHDLLRGAERASRMVVSTRRGGPVAAELRFAGLSVAAVEPSQPPPWFTPRVGPPGR